MHSVTQLVEIVPDEEKRDRVSSNNNSKCILCIIHSIYFAYFFNIVFDCIMVAWPYCEDDIIVCFSWCTSCVKKCRKMIKSLYLLEEKPRKSPKTKTYLPILNDIRAIPAITVWGEGWATFSASGGPPTILNFPAGPTPTMLFFQTGPPPTILNFFVSDPPPTIKKLKCFHPPSFFIKITCQTHPHFLKKITWPTLIF